MLVSCPECGRDGVSSSASACPSCGFNINYNVCSKCGCTEIKGKIFPSGAAHRICASCTNIVSVFLPDDY